jgi:hypothetical protein
MPHRRTPGQETLSPAVVVTPLAVALFGCVRIILRFGLVYRSATVVPASGTMHGTSLNTGGGLLRSQLFALQVQDGGAEDD